jgi:phenylacetate-CoA ligase
MLVKVEAADHGANHEALATVLEEHLRSHLGMRLETEVVEAGSLPRYQLKSKRIFDQRSPEERPSFDFGSRAR